MSTLLPTPEERASRVLAAAQAGPIASVSPARTAQLVTDAIREAEADARKDERATCARIVKSGIHCGAPPESIAAMIEAGAELEPLGPPGVWPESARYLTDDRDRPPRHELVILHAGDGDWYVSVLPEGHRMGPTVRLCTSGGAATAAPGLTAAIRGAYLALVSAQRAGRFEVASSAKPPDRLLVSRAALVHAFEHEGGDLVEEHRTHIEGVLRETKGRTAVCGVPALRALLDLKSLGGNSDPAGYMSERALQAAFLGAGL